MYGMHIYLNRNKGRGRDDSEDTKESSSKRFTGEDNIKRKLFLKGTQKYTVPNRKASLWCGSN